MRCDSNRSVRGWVGAWPGRVPYQQANMADGCVGPCSLPRGPALGLRKQRFRQVVGLSAVPRVDGLNSAMEHDGVALYPWATVSPKMSWTSQFSADIQLATPGGFERFATLEFTAVMGNTQMYAGVLKLTDGTAVAEFERAGGGTSYTTAAGVDVGLFVAAHVASVKIMRDSIVGGA